MREYYIRREGDEDASGPFDIDQISSLIEAGKLDPSAYFYDIETESWLPISSNQELMETLYPKKRKLSLRTEESEAEKEKLAQQAAAEAEAKAEAATSEDSGQEQAGADKDPASADDAPPATNPAAEPKAKDKKKKEEPSEPPRAKLEVTKMLAIAEGRADDPTGKSPREKQAAVAFFGLRFLTLFFIASILAMAFIEKDLILTANAINMAKSPFLLLAAFDLLLVGTLLLQVTEVYPLLRFRAAVGAGLLSMLFYSSGDTLLLVSNLLLMTSIYFCSAIIKIRFLIACLAAGFAGIFGYAYVFLLA